MVITMREGEIERERQRERDRESERERDLNLGKTINFVNECLRLYVYLQMLL